MKKICLLLCVFLCAAVFPATAADVLYQGHKAAADHLLLELDGRADFQTTLASVRSLSFDVVSAAQKNGRLVTTLKKEFKSLTPDRLRYVKIGIPQGLDFHKAMERASKISGVSKVWPDYRLELLDFTPNDPLFADTQSNLRQVNFPYAWDLTFGAGVVVAVIDTGYRSGLDDAATLVSPYDFWGLDEDVQDFIGHGTHVANTIAEASNNDVGCASIAPAATIMPLKVFPDYDGAAYDSDVALAIDWARENGADVINMSLGGGGFSGISDGASQQAYEAGILVFAAAGNSGASPVEYPAGYDSVIAIGSSRPHGDGETPTRSDFSNWGDGLDLLAPGEAIVQETWSSGGGIGYYSYYGTSSASPHAAGLGALLKSLAGDDVSVDMIIQAMTDSANTSFEEWDEGIGYGEIDAKAAVQVFSESVPNEPPVAVIDADKVKGSAPLRVTFSGGQSYDPDHNLESYMWSLPNMSVLSGSTIEYTFTSPGTYSVMLTVTDKLGKSDSASVAILVSASTSGGDDDDDDGGGCSLAGAAGEGDVAGIALALSPFLAVFGNAFGRRIFLKRRGARKTPR